MKHTIYLPDDVEALYQANREELNLSFLIQQAILMELSK